jgi:hypothetical protein
MNSSSLKYNIHRQRIKFAGVGFIRRPITTQDLKFIVVIPLIYAILRPFVLSRLLDDFGSKSGRNPIATQKRFYESKHRFWSSGSLKNNYEADKFSLL